MVAACKGVDIVLSIIVTLNINQSIVYCCKEAGRNSCGMIYWYATQGWRSISTNVALELDLKSCFGVAASNPSQYATDNCFGFKFFWCKTREIQAPPKPPFRKGVLHSSGRYSTEVYTYHGLQYAVGYDRSTDLSKTKTCIFFRPLDFANGEEKSFGGDIRNLFLRTNTFYRTVDNQLESVLIAPALPQKNFGDCTICGRN